MSHPIRGALAASVLAFAVPAAAHVPVIPARDPSITKPYVIDRFPLQSRSIFQELDRPGDIDVYEVVVNEPMALLVQAGVPAECSAEEAAQPWVTVVGPGSAVLRGQPGISMSAGFYQTQLFEEEYSGFTFALGPELRASLVLPGTYRIYVWDPQGRTGHYQLNYNESEAFFSQLLPEVTAACAQLADVPRTFYPECTRFLEPPRCCEFGVQGGACAAP